MFYFVLFHTAWQYHFGSSLCVRDPPGSRTLQRTGDKAICCSKDGPLCVGSVGRRTPAYLRSISPSSQDELRGWLGQLPQIRTVHPRHHRHLQSPRRRHLRGLRHHHRHRRRPASPRLHPRRRQSRRYRLHQASVLCTADTA